MDVFNLVNEFISKISSEYPLLHIDYEYDSNEDEYIIWHNDSQLEYNDSSFKSFVAKAANEFFFNNNIYNFSFGYNHFKSIELKNREITFDISTIDKIDFGYTSALDNKINYLIDYNLNFNFRNDMRIGELFDEYIKTKIQSYSIFEPIQSIEDTMYIDSFFKEAS
jgi:hypothetical protein